MALKSIVSSTWVHRDLLSLPAAMAVTSLLMMYPLMVVTVWHQHLESQPWYDKILVVQQVALTAWSLLHVVPCSGQLAAVHHLGLALCKVFTLLSRFSLITIELELDILYIKRYSKWQLWQFMIKGIVSYLTTVTCMCVTSTILIVHS